MKNNTVGVLFFLIIITVVNLKAGTIIVGDCVYGQEGGDLLKVSWNGDTSGITMPDKTFVSARVASKEHPLSWHKDLHQNLDLVWVISGDLDKVNQAVDTHQPADRPATWIWSGAFSSTASTSLTIDLNKNGIGRVNFWQAGKRVGSCRCRTSSDSAKVSVGSKTITGKSYGSHDGRPARKSFKASEKAGKDVWMYYAMCLGDEADGVFIHGGNQAGESGGCFRLPFYMDEYAHRLLKAGSKVEVDQK